MMHAGYLFTLNDQEVLMNYIRHGIYGTRITAGQYWRPEQALTLADYSSMTEGDWVFFFIKRMIYGAGRLRAINIEGTPSVVFCNYPKSYLAGFRASSNTLWDETVPDDKDIRWLLTFSPSPIFLQQGLDMDQILQSDLSSSVRSLRVLEKLSFIKMEPDEVEIILNLLSRNGNASAFDSSCADTTYSRIQSQISGSHALRIDDMLMHEVRGDTIRLEAALHAWLVYHLSHKTDDVVRVLGKWDYISNLVPASPSKPVMYMDKIDIFGYSYINMFGVPAVSQYLMLEVKSGVVSDTAVIGQAMKYVDWLAHTRAGGDYSMIKAFIVAHDYSPDIVIYTQTNAKRQYIVPRRPYPTEEWTSLNLVRYKVTNGGLSLEIVT